MSTQRTVTTETRLEEAGSLLDDVIRATSVQPTVMRHPAAALPPAEVWKLADSAAASGMFPGVKDADQAMVLMQLCQADGLHPIDAIRRYHVIQGQPSMRADAMLAEFQARGGRVMWHTRTDDEVSATFAHPSGGEARITWDRKTADERKISFDWDKTNKKYKPKHNWTTFPRQMLTARVISEGVRLILPGVVVGVYTPEEVEDFTPWPSNGAPASAADKPTPKTDPEPKPGNKRSPGDVIKAALHKYGAAGGWLDEESGKPVKARLDAVKAYLGITGDATYDEARKVGDVFKEGWWLFQDRMEAEQQMAEEAKRKAAKAQPAEDEPAPFDFGDDEANDHFGPAGK